MSSLYFPGHPGPFAPECLEPPKVAGQCEAAIARWSYIRETNTCEQFLWGGCDALSHNKFESMADCETTCKPAGCPLSPMCANYCEHGYKKDVFGCDTCDCNLCSPVMCMMYCEHGFEQDEYGCDICKCRGKHQSHSVLNKETVLEMEAVNDIE